MKFWPTLATTAASNGKMNDRIRIGDPTSMKTKEQVQSDLLVSLYIVVIQRGESSWGKEISETENR
jgi:hypothetical protein